MPQVCRAAGSRQQRPPPCRAARPAFCSAPRPRQNLVATAAAVNSNARRMKRTLEAGQQGARIRRSGAVSQPEARCRAAVPPRLLIGAAAGNAAMALQNTTQPAPNVRLPIRSAAEKRAAQRKCARAAPRRRKRRAGAVFRRRVMRAECCRSAQDMAFFQSRRVFRRQHAARRRGCPMRTGSARRQFAARSCRYGRGQGAAVRARRGARYSAHQAPPPARLPPSIHHVHAFRRQQDGKEPRQAGAQRPRDRLPAVRIRSECLPPARIELFTACAARRARA